MRKQHGLCWATVSRAVRRCLCGLVLGLALCTEDVAALTYYISPMGNDASAGTVNSPWETFDYAMFRTTCGDTLVLKDGEYTKAIHGSLSITKSCTASTSFTVQAQNQRKAHLNGDGSYTPLRVLSSAYVLVDGLRISSNDNSCCSGSAFPNVEVNNNSTKVTLKNLLVHNNNRYQNTALIRVFNTTESLLEDIELYTYHRHGAILGQNTINNIMRRIYCNSRGHTDIAGGYPSGFTTVGDSCVIEYPTAGTIRNTGNLFENILSEGNGTAVAIEAKNGPIGTRVRGVISLADNTALWYRARGAGSESLQPVDVSTVDAVVIYPINVGLRFSGTKNATAAGITIYNSVQGSGLYAEQESTLNGGGTLSFHATNVLSVRNTIGFNVTEQTTWSIDYSNAFGNKTNYSLSSDANYNPLGTRTVIDPQLGTCRMWIPDNSPMKGAGKNGADIGANILYRYQNGELTNIPLWDRSTGEFPHGALVSGVNDIPGESLFDVHKRLNVNINGCLFPKSYAQGGDTAWPGAPRDLAVR